MDANEFRANGQAVIELIAQYLETIEQRPVTADVRPGDIRSMLPEHPPTSPESFDDVLRDVNNIPPRMSLRAGSSLLVPRTGQRNSDVPLHVADNAQLNLQPEMVLRRSVVKARKGDNLARLAQRYGLSAVSVAGWNKLAVNAALKPGQSITLMLPQRAAVAKASDNRKTSAKKTVTASRKAAPSARQPVKAKATNSAGKTRVASSGKSDKKN